VFDPRRYDVSTASPICSHRKSVWLSYTGLHLHSSRFDSRKASEVARLQFSMLMASVALHASRARQIPEVGRYR